jgi:type I restriction enzyme R subunit
MSVEHSELIFENRLIKHLENIGSSKQWYFVLEISTAEHLRAKFKQIIGMIKGSWNA